MAFETGIVAGISGGLGLALFYVYSFWRVLKSNPGNRVIECGSITIIAFVMMLTLSRIPNFPSWIPAGLGILIFPLCLLTIFFLLQQGYRRFAPPEELLNSLN